MRLGRATQRRVLSLARRPAAFDHAAHADAIQRRAAVAASDYLDKAQQVSQRPQNAQKAQQSASVSAHVVRAPEGPRRDRRVLHFVAATDRLMPGMFGRIKLQVSRESVDLERLQRGVLSLCLDHDVTQPVGRVTEARISPGALRLSAEIARTSRARDFLTEYDERLRAGFSPGFLVGDVEAHEDNDGLYFNVSRWGPHEVSSTTVPRNPEATASVVTQFGAAFMSLSETPNVVSISDPYALTVRLVEAALDNPATSDRNRARLQLFMDTYHARLQAGDGVGAAALAARDAAQAA